MARNDPPEPIAVEQIRGYAASLREVADSLDHAASKMESVGKQQIMTLNFKTGRAGLKSLTSFGTAVLASFWRSLTEDEGVSVLEEFNERKGRTTSSDKQVDEVIRNAEVASNLLNNRKSKRNSKGE